MDKVTEIFTSLVEKKFSHQKIFASILLIFISTNIENNDFKSFSEWIFRQDIKIFLKFYSSLTDIKISSIVYSFIFIFLFSKLYLKINEIIIKGQIKNDEFIKKINHMKEDVEKRINLEKRLIIKKLYKEDADEIKIKLNSMTDNGSSMFSLAACLLIHMNHLGAIDFLLIFLIFSKSIHYLYSTTSFFIEQNTRIIFIESISKSIAMDKIYQDSAENI